MQNSIFAFYLPMLIWEAELQNRRGSTRCAGEREMTTVEILNIQEAGRDYLVLKNSETGVRVNFDDDKEYTKEESAAFFRSLVGKPAAIPADLDQPFFIAVDFWPLSDNDVRVVPFRFGVSS